MISESKEQNLRQQLSVLVRDPLLDELELGLREPNLFKALGLSSAEIRHSNFLAWLLDPNGNHGLGDYFLRRVLQEVLSAREHPEISEFDLDDMDAGSIEIRREWQNIDILIRTDEFVVCIENKVYSGEHDGQLSKYREVTQREFPKIPKVFVFLTPHGQAPEREKDALTYVNYSYERIAENLETVVRIYSKSLSPKILHYIEDYLVVIRRDIMKDDRLNELAARIYSSHRDAFDFIFANRPDRLSDALDIFKRRIAKAGYSLAGCQKGYARFLTRRLDDVIPKTGTGWKDKWIFLFEFDFWPKKITFKTVVSPGNERDRRVLIEAISGLEGAKVPKGEQWVAQITRRASFDVTDVSHSDADLEAKLDSMWAAVSETVDRVEAALLKVADKLSTSDETM